MSSCATGASGGSSTSRRCRTGSSRRNWGSSISSAASKSPGSRFYFLSGLGARLQRAVIAWMLDLHIEQHGYTEIYPPYLVRSESLVGTGQLPKFADNQYHDAPSDLWMIPTAEVPVTNMHRDEILEPGDAAAVLRRLHRLLPPRAVLGRSRHARDQARPPVRQGRDGPLRRAGRRATPR